jgi:hypothetical protein
VCLFESVVVVAFQSVFCVEIHQNDVFFLFFFKKSFSRSAQQNNPKDIKKLFFN